MIRDAPSLGARAVARKVRRFCRMALRGGKAMMIYDDWLVLLPLLRLLVLLRPPPPVLLHSSDAFVVVVPG